ncbi:hypothetical protein CSPAE12_03275 [Colletotrichum incanum]|nr:hypothetical protein CSPAE12_03275 [Colletotrichum incanum]
MNLKVVLSMLFASAALAVPSQAQEENNVLARAPQRGRPSGPSCCSYIPGTCNCSCVSYY